MRLYLAQVGAILRKDLVLELRTRERLVAMGAFGVLAGVLFNYALDPAVVRPQDAAAGLIWMTIVFAGLLGVGRTFHLEREDGAIHGLLTSPVPKDALYLGKTLANFVLVLAAALLIVAVFWLFFGLEIRGGPVWITLVLALGVLGFVALTTLFAALSTGTRMGETLLPILVFPLLVPMVVFGTGATARLLVGRPPAEVAGHVRMLAAFALLALAAGATLFRFAVEE